MSSIELLKGPGQRHSPLGYLWRSCPDSYNLWLWDLLTPGDRYLKPSCTSMLMIRWQSWWEPTHDGGGWQQSFSIGWMLLGVPIAYHKAVLAHETTWIGIKVVLLGPAHHCGSPQAESWGARGAHQESACEQRDSYQVIEKAHWQGDVNCHSDLRVATFCARTVCCAIWDKY